MSRSKVAAALALVVALSFAVPALAGSASPIKVAKKALGLSKKADKRSRSALKRANTANANAKSALAKLAGPQPEATHATNADFASSAGRASSAEFVDGLSSLPLVKLGALPAAGSGPTDYDTARVASPEITVFEKGPLRVYAKCFGFTSGNPNVYAEVYLKTTQDGVVFDGAVSDSGNGYLNANEAETNRVLMSRSSADTPGTVNADDAGDGAFYAYAPDGTSIQGFLHLATKAGSPPAGDGAFGSSNCLVGGMIAAR